MAHPISTNYPLKGDDLRPITTPFIVLVAFALNSITFAAEQTAPDVGSWHSRWHEHIPEFWWIFPLMMMFMFMFMFFVFFFVFSGGRWRRWQRWMRGYPESRHTFEGDQDATLESALDILNKRYARGEIDKEEYEDKKAAIISSNT